MVSTRTKNKLCHPAAPVMTNAAKEKAGIKTKRRQKRVTKDETIRQLQARIAALEDPDGDSFSQEPLVNIVLLVWTYTTLTTSSFWRGMTIHHRMLKTVRWPTSQRRSILMIKAPPLGKSEPQVVLLPTHGKLLRKRDTS